MPDTYVSNLIQLLVCNSEEGKCRAGVRFISEKRKQWGEIKQRISIWAFGRSPILPLYQSGMWNSERDIDKDYKCDFQEIFPEVIFLRTEKAVKYLLGTEIKRGGSRVDYSVVVFKKSESRKFP